MKENSTMEVHPNEMMNLFQKLSDLGSPADDEWKIGMIFTSSPSSYSILITALEARDEKESKISSVHSTSKKIKIMVIIRMKKFCK